MARPSRARHWLDAVALRPDPVEKYGEDGVSLDKALLIQLLGSAVAIAALVGLAAWAGIARPSPPLDAQTLATLLADEFPDHHPTATWISADGSGALAREGDRVLVLWRRGDGYVARETRWQALAAATAQKGRVKLPVDDASPVFAVADDIWPPRTLAA